MLVPESLDVFLALDGSSLVVDDDVAAGGDVLAFSEIDGVKVLVFDNLALLAVVLAVDGDRVVHRHVGAGHLTQPAIGKRRHLVVGGTHLNQNLTAVDLLSLGRQHNGSVVRLALVVEATNQEPLPFVAQKLYGLSGTFTLMKGHTYFTTNHLGRFGLNFPKK